MNIAILLPVIAGAAIALQTVLNSMGMRFLGLGGLIGFSGLVTCGYHEMHNSMEAVALCGVPGA